MDKQKQIEEMAKVVERDMCGDRPCKECNYHGFKTKILPRYCGTYLIAEKLYNAGYRKIQKNAVVLTREEYEHINSCYNTVRKETAEKFAERLKERLNIPIDYLDEKVIDEICKEIIGVPTTAELLENGKQKCEVKLAKDIIGVKYE